jgi:hypothetical protein
MTENAFRPIEYLKHVSTTLPISSHSTLPIATTLPHHHEQQVSTVYNTINMDLVEQAEAREVGLVTQGLKAPGFKP